MFALRDPDGAIGEVDSGRAAASIPDAAFALGNPNGAIGEIGGGCAAVSVDVFFCFLGSRFCFDCEGERVLFVPLVHASVSSSISMSISSRLIPRRPLSLCLRAHCAYTSVPIFRS